MGLIFKRKTTPPPLPNDIIDHAPLIPTPPQHLLGGSDVNLIRMVEENAPRRIHEIDSTVTDLQARIDKMLAERKKLERLLTALTE
jgi:hypothetical protein